MGAERVLSVSISILLAAMVFGQRMLQRNVQVVANNVRLSEALDLVARDGGILLSYNAARIRSDSIVSVTINATVEDALRTLLGSKAQFKETGTHVVILDGERTERKFTISGSVHDARTGSAIPRAIVYEVDGRSMVSTDASGNFRIAVSGEQDRPAIIVMRKAYHDTVVYVDPGRGPTFIVLREKASLERIDPICLHERCEVEDLGVARLLVPNEQLGRSIDISFEEHSLVQLSLIPSVSTNGSISGVVVNTLSLNLIAGYARGLEGLEIGGVANLENRDVKGLQIAGLTNLVGRNTEGVQIAGGVNHTMRSLDGVQIAGMANTVWDTLNGMQISGGVNVVKGGLHGTQISGFANMATQHVDGVQFTGGVNVTPFDVRKTQIAGAGNYARNVYGAQFSFGANVARDSVGGGQIGFAANYARTVSGGQVGLGTNVALGHVSGAQIGLALNYAGSTDGTQFSLGINVVRRAVGSGQFGLGLNYAGNIIGRQAGLGLNVVSGTASKGQIGTLNFARKCLGNQWGIINLSDTLSRASIGLISYSIKGYHRVDLVTTDVMPLTLRFRTGTRGFHNILGYSPAVSTDERWGFLYGLGTEARLGKNGFMNVDLTGEQILEQREWVDAVNILGNLGLAFGHRLVGPVFISAGAVVNVLVSDRRDPETGAYLTTLPPSHAYQEDHGPIRLSGWIGWNASVGTYF